MARTAKLPDYMTTEDLGKQGFTVTVDVQGWVKRVKHFRYRSYRCQCTTCQLWCKQLVGYREEMECARCLRKRYKEQKESL